MMTDPWFIANWELALRLIAAFVFGGLFGLEREQANLAAGFRTHILVCLGAALVMLISIYGFAEFADEPEVQMDPGRIAAQVVTGIGFLGAGVILYTGVSIRGLTTAASLWVVAAIGLAVGAGFYIPALITTVLVLFSLFVLNKVERRWLNVRREHRLIVTVKGGQQVTGQIYELLEQNDIDLGKVTINITRTRTEQETTSRIDVGYLLRRDQLDRQLYLTDQISRMDGVVEVRSQ